MIARTSALLLVGCLAACGCTGSSRKGETGPSNGGNETKAPDGSVAMKSTKTPDGGGGATFVRGPDLAPAAELMSWLDAQRVEVGKKRHVRLPVWLTMSALGIKGARIGADDGPDAIRITVRDTAMGISLADHARRACRGQPSCALWLEGEWKGEGRFEVYKVVRAIAPDEAATYVEIEP